MRRGDNVGSTLEMQVFSMVFQRRIEVRQTMIGGPPQLVGQAIGHPAWPSIALLLDWSVHGGGHYDVLWPATSALATAPAAVAS